MPFFLVKHHKMCPSQLASVYNSQFLDQYVEFVSPKVKDMMIVLSAIELNEVQCLNV